MIPYIIKSFRGGVSDENDKGIAGSFKYGDSLDIHGRNDVLTNGSSVVTVDSTTITDLIQFFVPASDGSMYAFGSAGSIYAISGDTNDPAVNFAYNDEAGNILGAAEFQDSAGVSYMYWATATQISQRAMSSGEKAVPWTNVTANYKTDKISSSATWHPMNTAMGQLNIGNGSDLATLDYSLAFNPSGLNLIPGNNISCLDERDDYVLIGSQRLDQGESGYIWSWITTATNWVQKKRIPAKGVNSLITSELLLLQAGSNGDIFYSDFVNQTSLIAIPGAGKTNPGGVSILENLAMFGFYGGTYPGIWSYGRKRKNRPEALNYEYRLAATVAGSSVSTIGAIAVNNGVLFASWGTTDGSTNDYGLDCISSTTKATQAVYEGLEFDGGQTHISKLVDSIALTLSPLVSGTSVSAKFKLDKESAWRYAVLGDNTTTFTTSGEVLAIFNLGKPGRIYEVGVELNASGANAPEVHSIVSYLSKENYEYA